MDEKKFDPKKLNKLNDPERLLDITPDYIWDKLNIVNKDIIVDIGAGTGFFSVQFLRYAQNGKIFACDISDIMVQLIVDWKKEDMPQGPPTHLRYLDEQVTSQLVRVGFQNIYIENELPKYFLLTAEKIRESGSS